jgi:RinA family phage transcriptional activator
MADKLDELLFSYFSGQIKNSIRLRRAELKFDSKMEDRNSGISAQNDYNNSVESGLMKEEADPKLSKLIRQKEWLDDLVSITNKDIVSVMRARYGARRGDWQSVAFKCKVDRATAIRYRNNFKKFVKKNKIL